jgi:hypothetical protein
MSIVRKKGGSDMSHSDFMRSEMSRQHQGELARELAEIRAAREESSADPRPSVWLGLAGAWQRLATAVTHANPRPAGRAAHPIR